MGPFGRASRFGVVRVVGAVGLGAVSVVRRAGLGPGFSFLVGMCGVLFWVVWSVVVPVLVVSPVSIIVLSIVRVAVVG